MAHELAKVPAVDEALHDLIPAAGPEEGGA
jgi:hypothetical protein